MATSSFSFLRGAAGLMARDLAGLPSTDLRVQLAGDAHLANFGVFGAPGDEMVFDVDDFDETLPGPWEWDLKRLAVSLVVAGPIVGLGPRESRRIAQLAVRTYRRLMARLATLPYLAVWSFHLDRRTVERHARRGAVRELRHELERSGRPGGWSVMPRYVTSRHRRWRIRDEPPLLVHPGGSHDLEEAHTLFEAYSASLDETVRGFLARYRVVDVARKVVGVGSVGTDCRVLLLMGDDDVEDPLLLQVKEARPSVLEPYLGAPIYPSPAERVVYGQRAIQEAPDPFLGWSTLADRHYYVRQLRDRRYTPAPDRMDARALRGHGMLAGAALARAHARTGSAAMIAGYLGNRPTVDDAFADFAMSYAPQVHDDYTALLRAIRRGRLPAVSAV
jgi:uncharacterized protein (DUF2252 family)